MTQRLARMTWSALSDAQKEAAMLRPAVRLDRDIQAAAAVIIDRVKADGDTALFELTAELDGVRLDALRVDETEKSRAGDQLSAEQKAAIDAAIANVSKFHEAQITKPIRVETSPGVVCEKDVRPLDAVGLYVPAGSAPLPSTAIMLGVPARIAGCSTRVICTPPRPDGTADPAVVVAALRCGVQTIIKLGGAQAVAAMAYGTSSVPKVDKIFGPGNAWVTAAKQAVAADPRGAALDLPAGPSEVLVVADGDADPRYVAYDLLSQAEHGPDSQVVLVTTSTGLADRVDAEIDSALSSLPRRDIICDALEHSLCFVVDDVQTGIDVANLYAPEHLILQFARARDCVPTIRNAGSVFIGAFTPEAAGDYCSGTNHVLPTYGFARNYSGLSLSDFQRQLTFQELSREGLAGLAPTVRTLAELEGLEAHARAVAVRVESDRP